MRNCSSALCSIGPRQITAWSSRAKKPIEISRTPLASGGMITSSMSPGGARDAEHARHREAPHVGVDRGDVVARGCASATDRLVVTDDLPTPPLPDATASTRVRESVKGFTRGGGLLGLRRVDAPAAGWAGATPLRRRPSATISSSVHVAEVDVDPLDARRPRPTASMIRRRSSAREASPGSGSRQRHHGGAAVDGHALDHAQLDDRAAQLGFLDRRQGGLDVETSGLSVRACGGS